MKERPSVGDTLGVIAKGTRFRPSSAGGLFHHMTITISPENAARIQTAAAVFRESPEEYINKCLAGYLDDVVDPGRLAEMDFSFRTYHDDIERRTVMLDALKHDLGRRRANGEPDALFARMLVEEYDFREDQVVADAIEVSLNWKSSGFVIRCTPASVPKINEEAAQ